MAGASDTPTLRRALGKWDLTAIGVNQVIGSAIFLLPADVAVRVGTWGPLAFLGVGLLSLSIALCFAEAGSRYDSTGGPILPARDAFGRFVGFEVGWMLWFAVAIQPRGGLNSRGRSLRKPSHSKSPEPGTGSRPSQPARRGESAEACHAMLPTESPQIIFSVGAL